MNPGCMEWDVELIGDLFQECDVNEILAIPLSQRPLTDKIIWHYSPKGDYSVKLAYRLVMDKIIKATHLYVPRNW